MNVEHIPYLSSWGETLSCPDTQLYLLVIWYWLTIDVDIVYPIIIRHDINTEKPRIK